MSIIKTPELKAEIETLSDKLLGGFTIDAKAGTAKASDDMYTSNLPEGLTADIVKNVGEFNTTFVAAGAHAFGKLAINAMKSNSELKKLEVDIPMVGKDNVSYTMERTKDIVNHLGGGETIHKFGVMTATLEMRAGKNSGQLKVARAVIGELAMAAFKK